PRRPLKQLIAPLFDLVRMDVELLRQLDHGLLALDRRHSHFRLECRAVVPAWSSCHGLLLACSIMPPLLGKSTYPGCSDCRNHLYELLLQAIATDHCSEVAGGKNQAVVG